jgi:hypothetical protein
MRNPIGQRSPRADRPTAFDLDHGDRATPVLLCRSPRWRRKATRRTDVDANEGMLDRTLRVIVGLAIIASPLGLYGIENANPWGWVGLLPLVTGLWGFCPAYKVLGVNTGAA